MKKVIEVLKKIVIVLAKILRRNNGALTFAGIGSVVAYFLLGGDSPEAGMCVAAVLPGLAGGVSLNGEPATLESAEEASEGLLRSAIDSRIVKVRPSATPIDQISRWGGSRKVGSMKVEYYVVDTKPFTDVTTAECPGGSDSGSLKVANYAMFSASDTLLLPGIKATAENGESAGDLVVYVVESSRSGLAVIPVNNYSGGELKMPDVPSGSKIVRMGRAACELDVQTDQFEALPTKDFNYCQIFKAQIEQSALLKLSNKEVRWTLSDMEESAIIDMRQAMEKSFLFGRRAKIENPDRHEPVYFTGGIWHQAGKEASYSVMNDATLVSLSRQAFTGCGGSSRKILVGGSGLIAALNGMEASRVVLDTQSRVCWGIDFSEIVTHFGSFYVVMSETFDQCGRPDDGMVIDPEYIVKYSHIPFGTERLDLRKSGQRNTEAVVITEASCMVLRYPESHMRIIKA